MRLGRPAGPGIGGGVRRVPLTPWWRSTTRTGPAARQPGIEQRRPRATVANTSRSCASAIAAVYGGGGGRSSRLRLAHRKVLGAPQRVATVSTVASPACPSAQQVPTPHGGPRRALEMHRTMRNRPGAAPRLAAAGASRRRSTRGVGGVADPRSCGPRRSSNSAGRPASTRVG